MAKAIRLNKKNTAQIRKLVETTSISTVAKQLNLANATVCRLAGGLPVSAGTLALVEQQLSELEKAGVSAG